MIKRHQMRYYPRMRQIVVNHNERASDEDLPHVAIPHVITFIIGSLLFVLGYFGFINSTPFFSWSHFDRSTLAATDRQVASLGDSLFSV